MKHAKNAKNNLFRHLRDSFQYNYCVMPAVFRMNEYIVNRPIYTIQYKFRSGQIPHIKQSHVTAIRSGVRFQFMGRLNKFLTERMGKYQAGEIASAKDRKLRLPKARSPSRLGGLGERRKLPQRDLWRSHRNQRDF